jgi:hypothetical protein
VPISASSQPPQPSAKALKKASSTAWAKCGDYVLKTDKSLVAKQPWEIYMTQLKPGAGFREPKGTLRVRPNFNQLQERVHGYMLMPLTPGYGTLRTGSKHSSSELTRSSAHQRARLSSAGWIGKRLETDNDRRDWQTIRPLVGIDWKSAFPTRETEIPE